MRYLVVLILVISGFIVGNNLHAEFSEFWNAQNCDMVAQNPSNSWFGEDSTFDEVIQAFGQMN